MKILKVTPEQLLKTDDPEVLLQYDYIIVEKDDFHKIVINTKYVNMIYIHKGIHVLISTISRELTIFKIEDSINVETEKLPDRVAVYPIKE
jgi:hypothetical protein